MIIIKRILLSIIAVGAVAGVSLLATNAFFSDTETSTGNTFTAGELDLLVDSTCHYNGNVCSGSVWEGNSSYPVPGSPCSCTWLEKNLNGDLFFNFNDVKPGDVGENTVSLHVKTNDAYVCAEISKANSVERGCNKPEELSGDPSCKGDDQGELQDYLLFTIWKDNGAGEGHKCNNVLDTDETALVTDQKMTNGVWPIADSQTGGPLAGDTTTCLGVSWKIPPETGNVIQGDMLTADISFSAMQARNNPGFVCNPPVLDYVDIGNVTSEAGHNISTADWSNPWVKPGWGGNYGGGSSDTSLRLLMGKGDVNSCADPAARPATFTMNAGTGTATKLTLEHLDGAVNDSFEVKINGVSRGTYIATSIGGVEVWKTTTFTFPGVTGTVNVELDATHPITAWCADWGQVGFSNAKLE